MFGEGQPSWTTGAIGWWFCSNFKVLPWICNRTTKNDWTLWHTMDSCASFWVLLGPNGWWIWQMHEAHSYDSESVWCVMCLKLFSIHSLLLLDLPWLLFWSILDPTVFTRKLYAAQFTFAKTVTCAKAQRLPRLLRAPCAASHGQTYRIPSVVFRPLDVQTLRCLWDSWGYTDPVSKLLSSV